MSGSDASRVPTWPDRRLIDRLKIEHPIVLAPMAGITTPELAASVCAGGGLGSLGCATMSPDVARTTISRLRALTSRPINVNFFCHAPVHSNVPLEEAWNERLESYYRELSLDRPSPFPRIDLPPFNEAMCSIVEDTRPEVVSFHFGLPEPALLSRVKAAGCLVMSSATTVEEARWLERHKADVIIAQGFEAGGHRGVFLTEDLGSAMASQPTTLALVPQIVDAVSVPVIAAGGIGDGRGIAAAFALGAAGVQIGTGYLLCPEAATSPLYREAIKQAHSDSTLVTNVLSGRPARALTNRLSRELGPLASDTPGFPIPMGVNAPLRTEAERRGLADFSAHWSGQAARLSREVAAEDLTRAFADEALQRMRTLSG